MKVSVVMITYNHESYITQAIESILMQETNFDYEIVIGEDCSTDRTRDIVKSFVAKYPDKILGLYPEKNLGMNRNFIQTYQACRGEYFAILEGDDYWLDSKKLQKQVDFLDTHPDFPICFHNAMIAYEDKVNANHPYCSKTQPEILSIENLLMENFIPTCSTLWRGGLILIKELPDWFYQIKQVDWPMHIFHAEHGKIGYINEIMAVYRVHNQSNWSSQSDLWKIEAMIQCVNYLKTYFSKKTTYIKILDKHLNKLYYLLVLYYYCQRNRIEFTTNLINYIKESNYNPKIFNTQLISILIQVYLPFFYKFFKKIFYALKSVEVPKNEK